MASITIQLSNICAGGGHGKLVVTGDVSKTEFIDIAEMQSNMAAMDSETILTAILRLKKVGLTNAQFKAALQAGFTVTV